MAFICGVVIGFVGGFYLAAKLEARIITKDDAEYFEEDE